ncbi:MAG: glycoside hydrolase family 9 protein, partial [Kiritimatiellia bacterium]
RCGGLNGHPFVIGKTAYETPLRTVLIYFNWQRCGDSRSGWNAPCHLEDGIVDGQRVDLAGGWHQSGDLRKWTWGSSFGLLGLGMTDLKRSPRWDSGQIAEEFRWGNQYFQKMIRPDGGLMDTVNLPYGWGPRTFYRQDGSLYSHYLVMAGQAIGARMFAKKDPAYALKCLGLAKRMWTYNAGLGANFKPYKPPAIPACHEWLATCFAAYYHGSCHDQAMKVYAAMRLAEAEPEGAWLPQAALAATALAKLQGEGDPALDPAAACFREAPEKPALSSFGCDISLGLIGMCDLIEQRPGHADRGVWTNAVGKAARQIRLISERNPWGLIATEWFSKDPGGGRKGGSGFYRYLPGGGPNTGILGVALFMRRAAAVLKEPAYDGVAWRQIDWILGCNPLAASTVEGIGYNQIWRYVPNEFYPPTPQIPGAVMIGIEGDEKDQPVRYRSHYPSVGCSEYDMPVTAEFLWLLAEITAEGANGK